MNRRVDRFAGPTMPDSALRAAFTDPDVDRLARSFRRALPFPHVVIDNIFLDAALDAVVDEFPGPRDIDWIRFDNELEKKLGLRDAGQLGETTGRLIGELNSAPFVIFLEALSGIEGLLPDPSLHGGGLHQVERDGFLEIHADFNWSEQLAARRRLNLLLYLNRDWRESYGGHLQMWNREMTRCERSILPVFNRCVIFETTDFSFHGHPEPLTCPPGVARRSIALYYYTREQVRESDLSQHHCTLFQRRLRDQPSQP